MLRKLIETAARAHDTLLRRSPATVGRKPPRGNRLTFEPLEPRLVLDAGPLIISEFLADNHDVLPDETGDVHDWIEIHNPTGTEVSLNGWHLTDDPEDLTKWRFPDVSLEAGGYLIVYASGEDHSVAGAELHGNFQLSSRGEYLALVRDDGATIAHDFHPEYPRQYENISYGVTQHVSTFVPEGAAMSYRVPTSDDAALGTDWTQLAFDDSDWTDSVATGVGFNLAPTGFDVTYYKANVSVGDLSTAESVIGDPAKQASVVSEIAEVINYYNTGGDGRYGGNSPFPGTSIGNDVEDFVVEATATVVIPSAGPWTFGVNSDDGFSLRLTNGADTFSTSYPSPRGPADTLGVFNVTQPGAYELRLVFYERGGGSGLELFAAQGSRSTFDAGAFRLVGDADGGGLLVTGFGGAIRTDVEMEMHETNASIWTRIPFQLDEASTLDSLRLRMRYNDGFVAYLNGQPIAGRKAPTTPLWNSHATSAQSFEQSSVFEEINVTASLGALRTGTNVLAVQGLNVSAADNDFLILPELIGTHTGDVQRYFAEPTPNGPNGGGFVGFVGDTTFSVDRGFYDQPFSLEITTDTPGATIRYTTDGSQPTATGGFVYGDPLSINKTTTLRAAAFKADHEPTNVDTHTYIFLDDVLTQSPNGQAPPGWPSGSVNGQVLDYGMDPDVVNDPVWEPQLKDALTSIPTMSLVTDVANLFDAGSGIYVNARNDGYDWERPTSIELIYPEGAEGPGFPDSDREGFQIDAGVRIRGGYSRSDGNPKHAFRFFFRQEYGDGKLNYPLFGEEGVDSFDKVDLRTSQNYSWSFGGDSNNAMVRDVYNRDTQAAMGQPYSRSRYYHLYINGQYWGLFQTQERTEAAYGASYFEGEREEFDTIKVGGGYNIHATDGTIDAWQDLWNQANAGFAGDAAYYRAQGLNPDGTRNPAYPVLLDVDNLIDYMLIVFYDGDKDAPISNFLSNNSPNNWYGVRNRNGEEGFRFFVHDAEHTLSRGNADRTGPWPAGDTFNKSNPQWIHQELMANEEYRRRFGDRVHELLFNDGLLTKDSASERLLARAEQIEMAIIAESARWGDSKTHPPRTKTHWQSAVNNEINNFFPNRSQVVIGQLRNTTLRSGTLAPLYPRVDAPSFNRHGGDVLADFDLLMGGASGTIWYTLDGSDPQMPDGSVSPSAEVFVSSTSHSTLVSQGATWKYLDDGSNQGTAWYAAAFNDGSWDSGPAQLGYGDGDEATVVGYGPNSSNKYTTTYFRHTFQVTNPLEFDGLTLEILRDDGAVVYLNGQEVVRSNMPGGTINYLARSSSTIGGSAEDTFYPYTIDPARLVAGDNVLAIEIHQTNATSSDISFDLKLKGTRTSTATPLSLSQSTLVKARALDGGDWSALNEAQFYIGIAATASNLAITELNYHPHDPTPQEQAAGVLDANEFEFIELRNVTAGEAVDLTGVRFSDGVEFDFTTGTVDTLHPGESVVVVNNLTAFEARYGAGVNVAGRYEGRLNNNGERIVLLDHYGEPIVDFTYGDAAPWPGRADGKGASLQLIDPAAVPSTMPERTEYLQDDRHWRSSVEYGGSPGSEGTDPVGVVVNEVLTHTDPPLVDTIELYNTTGEPINVGGWYLSDSWGWDFSADNGNYKKYRIDDGTTIDAHGYLVFDERHFNPSGGTDPEGHPNDFALSGAHGDDVWLMKANHAGELTHFADHVDFGAAAGGESFGRWPNGQGVLTPMITPTLDVEDPDRGENSGPRVGPVIISEVHFDPGTMESAAYLEFIEVYNPTGSPVDLGEWRIRAGIDFDLVAGAELGAHSALVILPFDPRNDANAEKWSTFCSQYGLDASQLEGFVGGYSGRLDNVGDRIQLQRPDEPPLDEPGFVPRLLEDEVRYGVESPWPNAPFGGGQSLHRLGAGLWGNDAESWAYAEPTPGTVELTQSAGVVGRYVFYDNSAFDRPGSGLTDDDAIAPDKEALRPGQTATFANYTSYVRGINGVMIDVAALSNAAALGSDDFEFRVGNSNDPNAWSAASQPLLTVRPGAGVGGSDRVTLRWPDNTIQDQWLQVTVLAVANTGLAAADVFYFGNAIGETGNSTVEAMVTSIDEISARENARVFDPATIDDRNDFDRDRMVTATDQIIARHHISIFNALQLIAVPIDEASAAAPTAVDAALTGVVQTQSDDPLAALWAADWGQRHEPTLFDGRLSDEDDAVARTVDELLALYWP